VKARPSRETLRLWVLAGALGFLALLYGLSFLQKPAFKTETGVLLTVSDPLQVKSIALADTSGGAITLARRDAPASSGGSQWVAEKEDVRFPVRRDYAEALIAEAAKPRPVTLISERPEAQEAHSLAENSAFRVEFLAPGGGVLSSLLFGKPDYTGRLIALRSALQDAAYYVEDDFSQSLTTESALWLEGRLVLPAVAPDAASVRSLTVIPAGGDAPLAAPEESFAGILALRSSRVISPEEAEARQAGPADIVRLEGDSPAIFTLRVFPLSGSNGDEYAWIPGFVPSPPPGLEDLRYALVTSGWTYRRVWEEIEKGKQED
jgi:hypothetical protein